ncbi:hypothetical protein CEUSTIGMA_g75.t1 [Chlamydomonas eustigma]|uniref:Exostosin GT47 domain-containing protein n=1 Tax=Chlamydomonas eustigma TaxID=1157962 RepID=A0A250WPK2_9CHLO|nr:hypothetical protein CEUSTIGMA_g75.t1 [Chlamydomonas eustigma]|eukprot:GAX72619.1 hypothetical protein CEUSTIGMA_g75.t1 [Chlamydomonas eustigma]
MKFSTIRSFVSKFVIFVSVTTYLSYTVAVNVFKDIKKPSVKLFIYQLPPHLEISAISHSHYGDSFTHRLKDSEFYEKDPRKADYFWIPSGGHVHNTSALLALLAYIKEQHPWWNETAARGEARHILATTFDGGAGESFRRGVSDLRNAKQRLELSSDPASSSRNLIFLTFNGLQDGAVIGQPECLSCFQPGKDIMIPAPWSCGPLCGQQQNEVQYLQQMSPWWQPTDRFQASLSKTRQRLMFFGGHVAKWTPQDPSGRGAAAILYANDTDFLFTRLGTSNFTETLLSTNFCYSPQGTFQGYPDRYISSIIFGCIPIMLNLTTSEQGPWQVPLAFPFEEVLPWHEFATVIDVQDMQRLKKQLLCLLPHAPGMRMGMEGIWQSMLYSSAFPGRGLKADPDKDAFVTLMRVLESRIPQGYRPSSQTYERLSHPASLFPCT